MPFYEPWWWIFPVVMPLAMIVAMIVMVLLFRSGWMPPMRMHEHSSKGQADPALEILRRRFASGEISLEEFERSRRLLDQ